MMEYHVKVGVLLLLILSFYKLCLERQKTLHFNRFFLLIGIGASFLIPVLNVGVVHFQKEVVSGMQTAMPATIKGEEYSYSMLLLGMYSVVVAALLVRFFVRLYQLTSVIRSHEKTAYKGVDLILLDQPCSPHTFLKSVFLNRADYESGAIEEEVLLHEWAHAKQLHSIDVILLELLAVFFWFQPAIYGLKRVVKLNHEFLADDAVLSKEVTLTQYQDILLTALETKAASDLSSGWNFQSTKKRLVMMQKKNSKSEMVRNGILSTLFLFGLMMAFGQNAQAQSQKSLKVVEQDRDAYFKDAVFKCEESSGKTVYKAYADMTDEEKGKVPPPPPKPGLAPLMQGAVVVVDKDGNVKTQDGNVAPPAPPAPPKR